MQMQMQMARTLSLLAFLVGFANCAESDPVVGGSDIDDDPIVGEPCAQPPAFVEDVAGCAPLASDYRPRQNNSALDGWPACISDDNLYHRIEESVSSIARVAAYDEIVRVLWQNGPPSHQDFIVARVVFEEEQGLGSRVARRFDPHFAAPTLGECEDEGVAAANPDYCVGPAVLQPSIVAAFADGAEGHNRIVNATVIEDAIRWFLYVSAIKEATTCTETAKDCDSAWAYYSGGAAREHPIGLASDIESLATEAHNRAYDGLLAVRCWRDLDNGEVANNATMRVQAIAQLDVALLRGMAVLIRRHFQLLECSTWDYQQAHLQALRLLVPLLDRESRARDAVVADLLLREINGSADAADISTVLDAIDTTYPCP